MEWTQDVFANKSAEDIDGFISKIDRIPCPEYDGIIWPSYIQFRLKGVKQALEDMVGFDMRKSDILICTYMKSGTHWIFEIIHMLLKKSAKLQKEVKTNTMLEMVSDLSILKEVPSPRVLNTHVPFRYFPRKHIENGGKIIHVLRNPKDVLVSYYNHGKKGILLNMDVSWEDFFEAWMKSKVPYGSWYDYELEMEQCQKDHPDSISTYFYEDLKRNPVNEIRRLASFLGSRCEEKFLAEIANETSFENMKKNKFDVSTLIYGEGFIYRKGKIGDWKNYFTEEQNEQFNKQFAEKMIDSKYKFQYE